jgi:hypothetical protein
LVAHSVASLVGNDSKVRVTVLAKLTNSLGIVELVVRQEVLRVLISVDLNLSESVVDGWDLDALGNSLIKPALENAQLVALLELLDNLFHGAL